MSAADQIEPVEKASLDELRALQLTRLKDVVRLVYDRVPHYRKKFETAGVHPDDLATLDDIVKFPLTTKDDLRANYPFGMFAAPMQEIIRIHASSGTTGKPTVVGYTKKDIETWSSLMARCIRAAGGSSRDKIHIAYGYGLFTGGLGAHYGGECLGAAVIPVGGGFTERQVQLINDFKPDILMATPSYTLAIADEFARQGLDPRQSSLRIGIFGAEPWSEGDASRNRPPFRYRRARSLWLVRGDWSWRCARIGRDKGRPDDLGGSFLSGDHRYTRDWRAAPLTANPASFVI